MTAFSLSARLRLGANSDLALSLPQSRLLSFGRASFAPSPFSARASAIRSRTCGRQRLAFLAVSATGGARKPNPSEGAEAAPPQSTKSQKCEPPLSPPLAGCSHPSRRGVTPHRDTFPKGKAKAALESQTFGTHQTCTAAHLCTEKPPD